MDEIYANVEQTKPVNPRPSTTQTGPRSSERRLHGSAVLCLGLLSVLLLAGLICLSVYYHDSIRRSAAELSAIKANLTESLLISDNKLHSLTEERGLLNASLIEVTKELDTLKSPCPGWRIFSCACYLLSNESGSWGKGEEDCKKRGAHLVVIDDIKEQMFLSNFTEGETMAWIGLTDTDKEGTWKWINGAQLSLKFWGKKQPDNGGGYQTLKEENCAHIKTGVNKENWNDLSCATSLRWICEKTV